MQTCCLLNIKFHSGGTYGIELVLMFGYCHTTVIYAKKDKTKKKNDVYTYMNRSRKTTSIRGDFDCHSWAAYTRISSRIT